MNAPSGIKQWLTTDQEMNMVHHVNERKLRENAFNVDDKSRNTDYSKDDFIKKKSTKENTTSIFSSIILQKGRNVILSYH